MRKFPDGNSVSISKLTGFFQVSNDYLLTGKGWKPTLPPDDSALPDFFHELPPDKQAQFLIYLKGYAGGVKQLSYPIVNFVKQENLSASPLIFLPLL